jgi:hypothetical protein
MWYMKLTISLLILLVIALPIWAQSTNPYELTWLAFASNGTASGGKYAVAAIVGQLDNQQLSGGSYNLAGHIGIGSAATATSTPISIPTATSISTPVATSTPVTGEAATPTPSPSTKLYFPAVRR